jgi:branched-chain amino acid aminotransferase
MICTLSKHEAEKQGYTDSLMLDHEGNVAEATGANIFLKIKIMKYTHQYLTLFWME